MYDFYLLTCNIKVKIKLSLYIFKAYRRTSDVAACILNLGSRRRWAVSITPQLPCPRASLDVLKKKKLLAPAWTRTPTCQAHTLITIPTSRMWRILFFYEIQWNSCNQTSSNSEILIIRRLRVIPRVELLLFTSQKICRWHWQISGTHSKKASKTDWLHRPLWHLLIPCLILDQFIQLWRLQKHSRLPWTSRWRFPNGISSD